MAELQPVALKPRYALWSLGFRPFYLLAGIFAAISIPMWICQYMGYLPYAYQRGFIWHAHEMLFGYTLAVVAGFLFTAIRVWTGQPTPTGPVLAAIALLWIAGRLLILTPFAMASALVNTAFPLAVAVGIAIPLLRSGNRRNYFFIALLIVLALAELTLHLSAMDVLAWPALASLQLGLDLVLFIIAVIGGRVIPMFTNNGIAGAQARRLPLVEKLALGAILLLLVADVVQPAAAVIAVIALMAAIAHAVRLYLWRPWRTLRTPLVWIVHAAYGWTVIYLLLRAAAAVGWLAMPLAVHALTIGGIGGMTMGMMTRTARGHTGRPLIADRFELSCFVLIQLAAFFRVFGGLLLPSAYLQSVIAAGICWSAAFTLFSVRYWPVLTQPRLDGKPG